MRPELVRQRHSHDCAIACLAMVMGCTLDEARAAFDRAYPGATAKGKAVNDGITHWETDVVLAENGFATATVWRGPKDNRKEPWPPAPFADRHIAQVVTPNGGHFVVVLRDGTVLDPARGEHRWDSYVTEVIEVQFLAAVVPVA